MNFKIMPLDWDTHHFGIESAKVNLESNVDSHEQMLIEKEIQKYEFVTIANVNNDIDNNIWIGEKTNAYLADFNIQFKKDITKDTTIANKFVANVHIQNNYPKNKQIIEIARNAFLDSRFIMDPNFDKEKSQKMYELWVSNSFNKEGKFFVVSEEGTTVSGFVIFSIKKNEIRLELIAVNEETRGQNIGTTLINVVEKFAFENEIRYLKVGTQAQNIRAMNFYNKNKFEQIEVVSIYHLWNSLPK